MTNPILLHPLIDRGVARSTEAFAGGVLVCACTERPVKVRVEGPIAHNHVCGYTKCWKPAGAPMYGPVEREHPFQGLDFIHPERFQESGWQEPGFAAFVSSIIEAGADPEGVDAIRQRLTKLELAPYDCLSPALMDYIASWTAARSHSTQHN